MLVHCRPKRDGWGGRRSWSGLRSRPQHDLWRGRHVAEGRVRPDSVVVPPPALDDDLGFLQRVEDFAVEQLVPELGVEALDVAVLPGRARRDVGGLGTDSRYPGLDGLGDELGAIVRSNMARHAA